MSGSSIDQKSRQEVSSTIPDWSREATNAFWSPSKKLLKSIRSYQNAENKGSFARKTLKSLAVLRYRFWSIVCASDIPINSNLGGGLLMPHPNGIVIHPKAEVGVSCLILQQVTLVSGVKLFGHVDIGAGAKIVNPVTIGEHSLIGANAVVTKDVPAYTVVAGAPAKVLRSLK